MVQLYFFMDETGDHSMQHIDLQYPVFGLGGMLCLKENYIYNINPAFDFLKYELFNKRNVILHSYDIRKSKKYFKKMMDKDFREKFYELFNQAFEETKFQMVFSFVNKNDHNSQYALPANPYELTLAFIMERLFFLTKDMGHRELKIIAESRDKKENDTLYETFLLYKKNGTSQVTSEELAFIEDLVFVDKSENENGHQIVDMCLYPIARTFINNKVHISCHTFKDKIYASPNGRIKGYGLKMFPNGNHSIIDEIVK